MSTIEDILAREILDSRGNPTVEAEVILRSGERALACAPSGASTGSREALELRDGNPERYMGKGVLCAVKNIKGPIKKALAGMSVEDQRQVDLKMTGIDGTDNKSVLGANAMLAVSLAVSKAAALNKGVPLYQHIAEINGTVGQYEMPTPMMNILNGGEHADNNLDIQEFMILPVGAKSFHEALRMGTEVFHTLRGILKKQGLNTAVGDEGGFAPDLESNAQALTVIMEAIEKAGYQPGKEIALGLDCAASEFYVDGQYRLKGERRSFSSEDFVNYLGGLVKDYPVISIEDGLDESDWNGWQYLTEALSDKAQLVGDDLFVTNTSIFRQGIEQNIANAILIKPNQIGSLTETLDAIKMAKEAGYAAVISHRSGETEDVTIADLAVGTAAGQIKTGSLCRSDRVAKYNQLLRIEEQLGDKARFHTFSGKC